MKILQIAKELSRRIQDIEDRVSSRQVPYIHMDADVIPNSSASDDRLRCSSQLKAATFGAAVFDGVTVITHTWKSLLR